MIGFFSLTNDTNSVVKKDNLFFVSVPDDLPPYEVKEKFAPVAQLFANHMDANKVFLNYGKDDFIEYDYSI